jgi:hypothetical protein
MSSSDARLPQTDFDLYGVVGIRLLQATPRDRRAVAGQLGLTPAPLTRPPDLIIEFVEHLPLSAPLRYLGVDEAGFTDDAFLVLRSKHHARATVQLPFAEIGGPCHIRCESGLPAVPLLIPIVNLTALNKGVLPMHASAFSYNGLGVLTTGWSKGGKTETLLAAMARGARYIGDEWVYISADGRRIWGIPEPIRVWEWHLQSMPAYRTQLGRQARLRLRMLNLVTQLLTHATATRRRAAPIRFLRRLTPLLQQQLHVDLPPQRLFGQAGVALEGPLDKVFFVASHASPDVTVAPMAGGEIAQRMVFSLQVERLPFFAYYLKFRFAFPAARNELIEQAEERQRTLLVRMLADKEAYALYHPYPVELPRLFDAIQPLLEQHSRS